MAEIRVKSTGTIKLYESDDTSNVTIASPASLGADRTVTLPDANVTLASGTMLATDGDGSSLTGLTAGQIPNLGASKITSGTMATARLGSGTASSSTVLYGDQTYKAEPGGGIANASQWRNTTSFAGDADPIASNLELVDTYGYGSLGSDMTESSGIFTFPSTGYWLVAGRFYSWLNGQNSLCYGYINVTTDNSSYNKAVYCAANMPNFLSTGISSSYGDFIIDVTSTSLVKVSFSVENANTSNNTDGNTAYSKTAFTFTRLGDT